METLAPLEGYDPELGLILAMWRQSTKDWLDNLGEVSDEALIAQSEPDGPSIGAMILHLISCARFWVICEGHGLTVDESHPAIAYDLTMDQYEPYWPTPPRKPFAWYKELFEANKEEIEELVRTQTEPRAICESRGRKFEYRWMLARQVGHDSYHGGQAVLLHERWKLKNSSLPSDAP